MYNNIDKVIMLANHQDNKYRTRYLYVFFKDSSKVDNVRYINEDYLINLLIYNCSISW